VILRNRDISSLLDMFTDDAVIHEPASAGVLPWGGVQDGRKGAAEFIMLLANPLNPNSLSCRNI